MSFKRASVLMGRLILAFMLFAMTGKNLFEFAPAIGWLGALICSLLQIVFHHMAKRRGELL
ncbi:type IV secretory pathway VirB6-like protein [Heliobacterium gestii]|nr:type IV secretory pathway VirB6-like protein [Heliomicrobium gestii]